MVRLKKKKLCERDGEECEEFSNRHQEFKSRDSEFYTEDILSEANYSVITQPAHHIVKGQKIVPIAPISVLITLIVIVNLIIMMIFVDLLARLAVGTKTGFGLWGPAVIIVFALGTLTVCNARFIFRFKSKNKIN
jgi:hypothetical protein